MGLQEVETFWGDSTIRLGSPSIQAHAEVIYSPLDPATFLDRDRNWGIYSKDGNILREAAYFRGTPPVLVGQSDAFDLESVPIYDAPEAEYIYGGVIIPHFGHFVVSSLARLWPFIEGRRFKGTKILVHAYGAPEGWFATAFVADLFRAAGLCEEDLISFDRVVKIKSLIVPEPSFGELNFGYSIHAELCHRIGHNLLKRGASSSADERPIYLSKTRLPIGVAKLKDEQILIEALKERLDINVIYPELLRLEDQIALFRKNVVVTGTISSAFHTSIFSENTPRLIPLSLTSTVASNFKIIDLINHNRSTYLFAENHFDTVARDENFLAMFETRNVTALAQDYSEFIQNEIGSNTRDNQPQREREMLRNSNNVSNLKGMDYRNALKALCDFKNPENYLEIGTLNGNTLAPINCKAIAIDPKFQVQRDVIGTKPMCLFFQMASDDFFKNHDPACLFEKKLDFVFLDGMHQCEFLLRDFLNTERFCERDAIITIHDCIPVEVPMTSRIQNSVPAEDPARGGWWTGDVWRTIVALKKMRPDLKIVALDAAPTGLIVITNLNSARPASYAEYDSISKYMNELDFTIEELHESLEIQSTSTIDTIEGIKALLCL